MPPDITPHEGYAWKVVVDADWRLVRTSHNCRYWQGHDEPVPAVAELNRSRRVGWPRYYAYCAEHMYGRWVEGGLVLHWALRPVQR